MKLTTCTSIYYPYICTAIYYTSIICEMYPICWCLTLTYTTKLVEPLHGKHRHFVFKMVLCILVFRFPFYSFDFVLPWVDKLTPLTSQSGQKLLQSNEKCFTASWAFWKEKVTSAAASLNKKSMTIFCSCWEFWL